jgi:hypothetical protein
LNKTSACWLSFYEEFFFLNQFIIKWIVYILF